MAMPWPPPTHIDSNPMVLSAFNNAYLGMVRQWQEMSPTTASWRWHQEPRIPLSAEALPYWNDTNTISGDSASTCSGAAIGRSSS